MIIFVTLRNPCEAVKHVESIMVLWHFVSFSPSTSPALGITEKTRDLKNQEHTRGIQSHNKNVGVLKLEIRRKK